MSEKRTKIILIFLMIASAVSGAGFVSACVFIPEYVFVSLPLFIAAITILFLIAARILKAGRWF